MACSLYNNNGYGCGGCVHFVKTNSVTDVGVFMVSGCELCGTSYNFPVIPVI